MIINPDQSKFKIYNFLRSDFPPKPRRNFFPVFADPPERSRASNNSWAIQNQTGDFRELDPLNLIVTGSKVTPIDFRSDHNLFDNLPFQF